PSIQTEGIEEITSDNALEASLTWIASSGLWPDFMKTA
ncbi:MAG: hypothetical protein RLZZ575_1044, partial [Actinomycetota bacterium]